MFQHGFLKDENALNNYLYKIIEKGPYFSKLENKMVDIPDILYYIRKGLNILPFFYYSEEEIKLYEYYTSQYYYMIEQNLFENEPNKKEKIKYDAVMNIVENVILHRKKKEEEYIFFRDNDNTNIDLDNILVFINENHAKYLSYPNTMIEKHLREDRYIQRYLITYNSNRVCEIINNPELPKIYKYYQEAADDYPQSIKDFVHHAIEHVEEYSYSIEEAKKKFKVFDPKDHKIYKKYNILRVYYS